MFEIYQDIALIGELNLVKTESHISYSLMAFSKYSQLTFHLSSSKHTTKTKNMFNKFLFTSIGNKIYVWNVFEKNDFFYSISK